MLDCAVPTPNAVLCFRERSSVGWDPSSAVAVSRADSGAGVAGGALAGGANGALPQVAK